MKSAVQNVDLLLSLDPMAVARYLEAHGWQERERLAEKVSVWVFKPASIQPGSDASGADGMVSELECKIELPLKPDVPGFSSHIHDVVQTLKQVENRSSFQILGDLVTEAANIQVQGTIAQIEAEGKGPWVTVLGCAIGKFRRIQVHLTERDRTLAEKAYQERLPVTCIGNLVKQNGNFLLKNPRNFALDDV